MSDRGRAGDRDRKRERDRNRNPGVRADVAGTYDRIAGHFSDTREYAWPEVEAFLDGRSGDIGLDLGCGNGRHAEAMLESGAAVRVAAADLSRGLLHAARERAAERGYAARLDVVGADAVDLPFRTGVFELAVYVATLHHLPTRDGRVASLDELVRVLAPGAPALVSAWSTAHDRFEDGEEGFDTTVDWTLPGGETVPRYYHIYAPEEFDADLAASGLSVERSEVSSGNCYAVVRAPK
jgi:ubiquinone/menaquinone biosynthesis C-methylase UbiE